jgi:hypothetical protein
VTIGGLSRGNVLDELGDRPVFGSDLVLAVVCQVIEADGSQNDFSR